MPELESRCLEAFPLWLKRLAEDVSQLAALLDREDLSSEARKNLAGAVNYLFKSLDLIPDGIEDLGFIDDAFVVRAAAASACRDGQAVEGEQGEVLSRLASEAELAREFLGDDFARLERFVEGLSRASVRGRSVEDIVSDPAVRSELLGDVRGWAKSYAAPAFSHDEKNLIKLRSFLKAKLPQ